MTIPHLRIARPVTDLTQAAKSIALGWGCKKSVSLLTIRGSVV